MTWTTSDPSVATVKNGKVKGLRVGAATIAASYNGLKGTLKIDVYDPAAPTAMAFRAGAKAEVKVKKTLDLTKLLVVTPSTAKAKDQKWSSSNPAVATVSKGKVKGVSAGTAVITASSAAGDLSATITVTVQ